MSSHFGSSFESTTVTHPHDVRLACSVPFYLCHFPACGAQLIAAIWLFGSGLRGNLRSAHCGVIADESIQRVWLTQFSCTLGYLQVLSLSGAEDGGFYDATRFWPFGKHRDHALSSPLPSLLWLIFIIVLCASLPFWRVEPCRWFCEFFCKQWPFWPHNNIVDNFAFGQEKATRQKTAGTLMGFGSN